MKISGFIKLEVQWDLDHHQPVVLVDGRSLADIMAEYLGLIKEGGTIERDYELWEMSVEIDTGKRP